MREANDRGASSVRGTKFVELLILLQYKSIKSSREEGRKFNRFSNVGII
jgi:hypothetical protein